MERRLQLLLDKESLAESRLSLDRKETTKFCQAVEDVLRGTMDEVSSQSAQSAALNCCDKDADAVQIGPPHSSNSMVGGPCADPGEKREPAKDTKANVVESSIVLDLNAPNREAPTRYSPSA